MGYRLIDNDNIKEILDNIKNKYEDYYVQDILSGNDLKLLLSYIEQLETDYKEASESVTWWQNRFNAVERDKKQLENNRDKAIDYIEEKGRLKYNPNELINVLKGDSDDK